MKRSQIRQPHSSKFSNAVLRIVGEIPRGKTMTYAEVAQAAGFPGSARAVGSLMAKNYNPKIPCHRVIRSDGKIGNYNRGGERMKQTLLLQEKAEYS